MKWVLIIAVTAPLLIVPSTLTGQRVAREDFSAWARTHALPVQLTGSGASAQDLAPLRAIAGNAQILAFGECQCISDMKCWRSAIA